MQPGRGSGGSLDGLDSVDENGGQAVAASDHADTHAGPEALRRLPANESVQEPHEARDLVCRALPVVRREAVERQRADAARGRRAHAPPDAADALLMPGGTRQPARGGPPAVAVEDQGDVDAV